MAAVASNFDTNVWMVVYTKSRSEKVVAKRLVDEGYEVYCPTKKIRRKWSDRFKTIEEPLFRSYCFLKISERERQKIHFVPGMVRFVFWQGKPAILQEQDLIKLKKWLNDFDHEQIKVKTFLPGDLLQIQSGILMEKTGILKEQKGSILKLFLLEIGIVISVNLKNNIVEKLAS